MIKILFLIWSFIYSFAYAADSADYTRCLNPVNSQLAQMTDLVNNTQPVNYASMPLLLQKDGKFKLDNLSARQGKLVKDGKKGVLTAPSFFMDRATGKSVQVSTVINITYDDKDRITQIEERPGPEKRKALGQMMGMTGPMGEAGFGTRLTYSGNDCEVDQTYSSYLADPAKRKFVESVLYDRQICQDLKPALAKLNRESLNKCSNLMSEMGRVLASRQQALAAQDKEFMTINLYGQKIPQNPFMFTLTVALSCRAMNAGQYAPDFDKERLDVEDKGNSSDDAGVAK